MDALRAAEIMMNCNSVSRVSPWPGRHYVNLYGTNRGWRGDQTAKVWIDEKGVIIYRPGKGMRSDAFEESLTSALSHAEANGILVVKDA